MNVLFITSNRIGDAVLSTGLLAHIIKEHPEAQFTIVCGPLCAPLFEGVPGLKKLIPMKKEKNSGHWFKLWPRVFARRWDMVVDLRDSAVSRLLWAKEKFNYSNQIDHTLHKVEQNAQVMGLDYAPAPQLWFTEEQEDTASKLIPDDKLVLGVAPTANWIGKTWPADRYIELIKTITGRSGILPEAHVAVFAADNEEDAALPVLHAVPAERQIDAIGKLDTGEAAAAIARCSLFIGNDSGLMHCAAAVGTPTLGLFGPSYPKLYSPWGAHTSYITTPETYDELIDFDGYDPHKVNSLMTSLKTISVINHCRYFWEDLTVRG